MLKQAIQEVQGGSSPTTPSKKNPKRNTLSFEPCGPLRSMIEAEIKRHGGGKKSRGALKRALEAVIIEALAPKYPKLYARYQVLKEEGAL